MEYDGAAHRLLVLEAVLRLERGLLDDLPKLAQSARTVAGDVTEVGSALCSFSAEENLACEPMATPAIDLQEAADRAMLAALGRGSQPSLVEFLQ